MAEVTVTVTLPVLHQGDGPGGLLGVHVQAMQALLNVKGHNPIATDGAFGPVTEAAVKDFQLDRSLAVDGIVGVNTWTALLDLPQTV